MHSFPHLHYELFGQLCERNGGTQQPLEPQLFSRWEQLLHASEHITHGIVLLDFDEAERNASLDALGISAHRLCSLILRDLREKPAALILLTRQDYAEIEDLLRAGVAALLHPRYGVEVLSDRAHTAWRRRLEAHAARCTATAELDADVVLSVARSARSTGDAKGEEPVLAPVPLLLSPASSTAVAP